MRKFLRRKKTGGGSFTYDPVRRNEAVLLNANESSERPSLFSFLNRPSDEKILISIARACKNDIEEKNCVGIAKAILAFYNEKKPVSTLEYFRSVRLTASTKARYNSPFLITIDSETYIMFSDMRRSHKLTAQAMKLVHAVNYHSFIVQEPDFENVGVMIANFLAIGGKERFLEPRYFLGEPCYDVQELNERFDAVHKIWVEILKERGKKSSNEFNDGLFKTG